jgi:hypothetical protein
MAAFAGVDRTDATPRVWFTDQLDFFNVNLWLGNESDAGMKLDLPTDIWMQAHQDWFVVKRRTAWTIDGQTHAPDTVLGISLSAFLAGDRNFAVIFEPEPRRALQGFFWSADRLVLPILDELRPVFEVLTPSAGGWSRGKLPGLPDIGVVDVWPLDTHESEGNGDLLANIQDPLTPSSLKLIERIESPTVLKQAPRTFPRTDLSSPSTRRFRSMASAFPTFRPDPPPRPAMRRSISTPMAASALPCGPITTRRSASCGSNAAAPAWSPTFAAAASSAHAGTMPAAMPASGLRMMILPRSPPTSCSAA